MTDLERWLAKLDLIDEQYAAIMNQWPDSVNALNEERKMLKSHLTAFSAIKENSNLVAAEYRLDANELSPDVDKVITAIDAEMPEIDRGDLFNIVVGFWTEEPGDELTEKTWDRKTKQEAAIMDAFAKLDIDPLSPSRGDRKQVMQMAIDDRHPLLTKSTAPKAYQRCLDKQSIAKSM